MEQIIECLVCEPLQLTYFNLSVLRIYLGVFFLFICCYSKSANVLLRLI